MCIEKFRKRRWAKFIPVSNKNQYFHVKKPHVAAEFVRKMAGSSASSLLRLLLAFTIVLKGKFLLFFTKNFTENITEKNLNSFILLFFTKLRKINKACVQFLNLSTQPRLSNVNKNKKRARSQLKCK